VLGRVVDRWSVQALDLFCAAASIALFTLLGGSAPVISSAVIASWACSSRERSPLFAGLIVAQSFTRGRTEARERSEPLEARAGYIRAQKYATLRQHVGRMKSGVDDNDDEARWPKRAEASLQSSEFRIATTE
jgi:hypothetical protein